MDATDSDYLSESLAFDDYVLDAELRELRGSQGRIEVQRKVLHLLFYLARHSDRVVSKEELLAGVWPGTVVTDAVLSQAVRKARSALGDDGSAQQLIRTVHGHGYRLQAEVAPARPAASTVREAAESDAPARLTPAFDPLERTVVPGLDEADLEATPDFGPPGARRGPPAQGPSAGAGDVPFEALPRPAADRPSANRPRLVIAVGLLLLAVLAASVLLA